MPTSGAVRAEPPPPVDHSTALYFMRANLPVDHGAAANPVRAGPPEPLDRGSRLGCRASQISSAGGPESRCELRESRPAGAFGPQYPHQSRTAPADGPWGHYMHRAA